jgi:hypothetical protein
LSPIRIVPFRLWVILRKRGRAELKAGVKIFPSPRRRDAKPGIRIFPVLRAILVFSNDPVGEKAFPPDVGSAMALEKIPYRVMSDKPRDIFSSNDLVILVNPR